MSEQARRMAEALERGFRHGKRSERRIRWLVVSWFRGTLALVQEVVALPHAHRQGCIFMAMGAQVKALWWRIVGRKYGPIGRILHYRDHWFAPWKVVRIRKVTTDWQISDEIINDVREQWGNELPESRENPPNRQ